MHAIRYALLASLVAASTAQENPWLPSASLDVGEARIALDLAGHLLDDACRLLPRRGGGFHVLVRSAIGASSLGTFVQRHAADGAVEPNFGLKPILHGNASITPRCGTAVA